MPSRIASCRSRRLALVVVAALAMATAGCASSVPVGPRVTSLASAAPAPALAEGRHVAKAFFARETHALWERFAPPLRAKVGSEEGLVAFRTLAEKQLGSETALLSEHVDHRAGLDLYTRIATYERSGTPIKMVVGFDEDRRISAFGITPDTQATAAPTAKSDYLTAASLRLPFEGAWNVAWGGRTIEQNQHVVVANQRFAYDFLVVEGGTTHRGNGTRNEDYFAYGRAIVAPAAGRVVARVDGIAENVPGSMDAAHLAGNHVIIDHGHGEHSLLAHLVPGSLLVQLGDQVTSGQPLGRCGNSGHSSEPHLHFHLQDGARLGEGVGLPAQFQDYVADGARIARGEPVRDQRVEPSPGASAKRD